LNGLRVLGPRQLTLQLHNAGQGALECFRQRAGQLVGRDADGLVQSAQRILGDDLVFVLAEDEPDGGLVRGVAQAVIHRIQVEIHLAGVLGPEAAHLQVDHDEAAQAQVIEEQINVEVLAPHLQVNLAADPGEARSEGHEEFLKVAEQAGLELAFMKGLLQREEVKDVGILQQLGRKVGLGRRQRAREVGHRLPLPLMGAILDLEEKELAAPAMLERLLGVPEARGPVLDLLEKGDVVGPGQFGNRRLPNCGGLRRRG
jgi:hypothetical protein